MNKETGEMIWISIMGFITFWCWLEMKNAQTLIEVLKNGFEYLATMILLMGMVGRKK